MIVIDAGHGGADPGAMGHRGLKEKNVTIEIALKLKKLLNKNKKFHTILTRNSDVYVSLKKRKEFLQKNYVNCLISIHVDSSKKKYVSGASLWIISNNRINREIKNYLKNNQSVKFSKNIQDTFNKNKNDIFLKKTILDLQFNNFHKIEIDLCEHLFEQFKNNINLHKTHPNYASLAILSSINVPSVLIETGFITNILEEKKLRTTNYQNKIAYSIYLALNNYFQNKSLDKK